MAENDRFSRSHRETTTDRRRTDRDHTDLRRADRAENVQVVTVAQGGHGPTRQALAMTVGGSVGFVPPQGTWPRHVLVLGVVAGLWLLGQLTAWLHVVGRRSMRRRKAPRRVCCRERTRRLPRNLRRSNRRRANVSEPIADERRAAQTRPLRRTRPARRSGRRNRS